MRRKAGRILRAGREAAPGEARHLDLFMAPEGWVYCVVEAPDAEAVRAHHERLGLPCATVRPLVLPPGGSHDAPEVRAYLSSRLRQLWEQEGPSSAS